MKESVVRIVIGCSSKSKEANEIPIGLYNLSRSQSLPASSITVYSAHAQFTVSAAGLIFVRCLVNVWSAGKQRLARVTSAGKQVSSALRAEEAADKFELNTTQQL